MEHTGFHEVVDGERYNPDCPECIRLGLSPLSRCPIGKKIGSVNCVPCEFSKEGLCDYPNSKNEPHWGLSEVIWAAPCLEYLARVRDGKKHKLDSIFTQIQILSLIPKRVV